jgi:hypothetical protein
MKSGGRLSANVIWNYSESKRAQKPSSYLPLARIHLAPDTDFIMSGKESYFQTGINALQQLTTGRIHLNVQA